jgi:hypothetical protein
MGQVELMMSTEAHDRHGKEVYEGDLIRFEEARYPSYMDKFSPSQ